MVAGESGVGALVRVDERLVKRLLYAPLAPGKAADGRWLFQAQPSKLGPDSKGRPVLVPNPAGSLTVALPATVAALLRAHAACMVLAGGAVLGAAAQIPPPGTDFDLFLHSIGAEEADVVAEAVKAAAAATGYAFVESSCALNFTPARERGPAGGKPFQLIKCLHRDRAQVLESFDLAPCKVLARADAASGAFVVEALPAWVESLRAMAFWVDPTTWSKSAITRIAKYVEKGFECAVPGTRREALVSQPRHSWFRQSGDDDVPQKDFMGSVDPRRSIQANVFTLQALFTAEAEHVYGTLGGGGERHWHWDAAKRGSYQTNPERVGAADVAAITAALWAAPELDVDRAKLPAQKQQKKTERGEELEEDGYPYRGRNTYENFWGPALREVRSTDASLARRDAAVRMAEEAAAAEGRGEVVVAAGSEGGGGGAPKVTWSVKRPELAWSTVRGIARFAPWDAGLATLHNVKRLAALVDAEAAARAGVGAAAGGHPCGACGKEGSKQFCGGCKMVRWGEGVGGGGGALGACTLRTSLKHHAPPPPPYSSAPLPGGLLRRRVPEE